MALGIALGLAIATGFTLWVTFLRLTIGTGPFERLGTPYSVTVLVYYVGFAIGGVLVGLLAPLRKSAIGSMLLGFLLVVPVYSGFLIAKVPRSELVTPFWIISTLGVSLIVGSGVGYAIWREQHPNARAGRGCSAASRPRERA